MNGLHCHYIIYCTCNWLELITLMFYDVKKVALSKTVCSTELGVLEVVNLVLNLPSAKQCLLGDSCAQLLNQFCVAQQRA